jgi:predicted Zn-dependent peptidase
MRKSQRLFFALLATVVLSAGAFAQDLASFEKRVTVRKLQNGLTLIVLERPEAPVFSFFTHVDAGGAQEVPGITGLAHMFEHMAFKGTDVIGTTDIAAERAALAKVEAAYDAWDAERRRMTGRDAAKVAQLEKEFRAAVDEADKYVVKNEFGDIIDRQGGVGLNAFTNSDETGYFYSMPANRLELWAYLESERFLNPVMREFYKERDVVQEERRMRTESNPIGRLIEQFLTTAFSAHTYGQPVVGWMSDLQSFSATDAEQFFRTHYIPANMTVAVVGDVRGADVIRTVEQYFGRIPGREKPDPVRTVEPKQRAERMVILREQSQPFYIEGYHKPAANHPDDAIYDVISDLLSNGRTSRLYKSLVRDKKIAAAASGFPSFPGSKYPSLFAFFGVPTPGNTPDAIRDAIRAEIEQLKTTNVTDEELRMVKTRAKANLVRQLDDNGGLAIQLATAHARYGDWRELFRQVERLEKVTAADIRRVANETFVASNRTSGILENESAAAPAKGASK